MAQTEYLVFRTNATEAWECIARCHAPNAQQAIKQTTADLDPTNVQRGSWAACPVSNWTWMHALEERTLNWSELELGSLPDNQLALDTEGEKETTP
jgi:hypothetical protein